MQNLYKVTDINQRKLYINANEKLYSENNI